MPFRSKAQQRFMFATMPTTAKRWAEHTPDMKSLPAKLTTSEPATGLILPTPPKTKRTTRAKAATLAPKKSFATITPYEFLARTMPTSSRKADSPAQSPPDFVATRKSSFPGAHFH